MASAHVIGKEPCADQRRQQERGWCNTKAGRSRPLAAGPGPVAFLSDPPMGRASQ
jgi:hypothetical protein